MGEETMCIDCNKVNTACRYDGEVVCASCSNKRYFAELQRGERVEIKLRLKNFKPGTYEQIRAIIETNRTGYD